MSVIDIARICSYFTLMVGMWFWFMRRNNDADVFIIERIAVPD